MGSMGAMGPLVGRRHVEEGPELLQGPLLPGRRRRRRQARARGHRGPGRLQGPARPRAPPAHRRAPGGHGLLRHRARSTTCRTKAQFVRITGAGLRESTPTTSPSPRKPRTTGRADAASTRRRRSTFRRVAKVVVSEHAIDALDFSAAAMHADPRHSTLMKHPRRSGPVTVGGISGRASLCRPGSSGRTCRSAPRGSWPAWRRRCAGCTPAAAPASAPRTPPSDPGPRSRRSWSSSTRTSSGAGPARARRPRRRWPRRRTPPRWRRRRHVVDRREAIRRADREFGPWSSSTPSGSSSSAPLKNMRARNPFISWRMTMFAPSWL